MTPFKTVQSKSLTLWAITLMAFLFAGTTLAQENLEEHTAQAEARWVIITDIGQEIADQDAAALIEEREQVRELMLAEQDAMAAVAQTRERYQTELDALGPAPAEGEAEEPDTLKLEREKIEENLALYDAAVRQSELNISTAGRVLEAIAEARRNLFYAQVLKSGPSPLSPSIIQQGVTGLVTAITRSITWIDADIERRQENESLPKDAAILGVALLIALLLFLPIRKRLSQMIVAYMQSHHSTNSRRILVAGAWTVVHVIPGIIGGLIVYEALKATDIIRTGVDGDQALAQAAWLAFLALLTVDGAAKAVFAQRVEGWELTQLSTYKAHLARFSLLFTTVILGADAVLKVLARNLMAPTETALLQSFLVACILATSIFLLSRATWAREFFHPLDQAQTDAKQQVPDRKVVTQIGLVGLLLTLIILCASAIGYVPFGYFLATRLFFLIGLSGAVWCARGVIREVLLKLSSKVFEPDKKPQDQTPQDNTQAEATKTVSMVQFWIFLSIDFLIFGAFIALSALVLGAAFSDVHDATVDAFFGFTIGSFTFSIADILSGVFIFLVIIGGTRLLQRAMKKHVFTKARIDVGVQHSLATLIGYAGMIIAGLAAIGVIGVDLSSLAIVAGALSVGIGFGLQSIVSNFVSGLILLLERPVKVGDWIIVTSGEGFVRRIGVRSTEIETFDRSSIIVPNSELIASTVTNLTLGNRMGRLIVPVGVSYDSDPEHVIDVLTDILNQNPNVLHHPEPTIAFIGLGDSSLDFEARGYIMDIQAGVGIRTQLRVAIVKRFREENIDIPFPQRVVHLDTSDEAIKADASEGEAAQNDANQSETAENDTPKKDAT